MAISPAAGKAAFFGGGSFGGNGHFTAGGISRKKKTGGHPGGGASRTPQGPPGSGGGGIKKTVVRHGTPKGSVSRTSSPKPRIDPKFQKPSGGLGARAKRRFSQGLGNRGYA